MAASDFPADACRRIVAAALDEDRAHDDATTGPIVPEDLQGTATFVARAPGVIAGLPAIAEVYSALGDNVTVDQRIDDGTAVEEGTVIAIARGPVATLLRGERLALNLLQRLSGVATVTRRYVDAIAGTGAVILDTRKTTPGLRELEKYAVRCGGGTNHRPDLASMAMIKDNHREALRRRGWSLADGVRAIREASPGVPVEVEIDGLDELDEALTAQPEWILLDNMPPDEMAEAARRTAGHAKLEASGGITLDTVRAAAASGVDAVSVGALTHSAPALDIALDLEF
jgi:nicotinate-nucleotide pyrophosphorylase (carboxylating)